MQMNGDRVAHRWRQNGADMNTSGEPQARQRSGDGPRLFAVALLLTLVFFGLSLGRSPVLKNEIAFDTAVQGVSAQLRHGAMGPAGRTAMASARPAAKKSGSRGDDGALPAAALTVIVLGRPGEALPQGSDPRLPEPIAPGYRARAPPRLV